MGAIGYIMNNYVWYEHVTVSIFFLPDKLYILSGKVFVFYR